MNKRFADNLIPYLICFFANVKVSVFSWFVVFNFLLGQSPSVKNAFTSQGMSGLVFPVIIAFLVMVMINAVIVFAIKQMKYKFWVYLLLCCIVSLPPYIEFLYRSYKLYG